VLPDPGVQLVEVRQPVPVARGDATSVVCRTSLPRSEARLPATEGRPLLVVEVLSPSTRRFDETVKRQVYAEMGIPSYCTVDITGPAVLALELEGAAYVPTARPTGETPVSLDQPFPVRFAATDLLMVPA
jgi:Uma2 family endonuclease